MDLASNPPRSSLPAVRSAVIEVEFGQDNVDLAGIESLVEAAKPGLRR